MARLCPQSWNLLSSLMMLIIVFSLCRSLSAKSLKLIVIISRTMNSAVAAMLASSADDQLSEMLEDFTECWGNLITYFLAVIHDSMKHQLGISTLLHWAALLDTRTKSTVLSY